MPRLWELTERLEAIRQAILDSDGEIGEQLEYELDNVTGDIETKITHMGRFVLELKGELKRAEEWKKHFEQVRKTYANTIQRVENLMHMELTKAQVESVEDTGGLGRWEPKFTPGQTVVRDFEKFRENVPDKFFDMVCVPKLTEVREAIDAEVLDAEDIGVEIVRKPKVQYYKTRKTSGKRRSRSEEVIPEVA